MVGHRQIASGAMNAAAAATTKAPTPATKEGGKSQRRRTPNASLSAACCALASRRCAWQAVLRAMRRTALAPPAGGRAATLSQHPER
jgi:hypothetical protein